VDPLFAALSVSTGVRSTSRAFQNGSHPHVGFREKNTEKNPIRVPYQMTRTERVCAATRQRLNEGEVGVYLS